MKSNKILFLINQIKETNSFNLCVSLQIDLSAQFSAFEYIGNDIIKSKNRKNLLTNTNIHSLKTNIYQFNNILICINKNK